MILSVIIILLVGLVAYFHYVQGFLSGLISAVLAVTCAALAMSFYEPVAAAMSGGKFSDQSQGVCLVAIFALSYLILRVLFDKLCPGNVRIPSIVDGVGGAICGLIAGVFATGIVVVAAQSMPFGPSIGGYTRYPLNNEKLVSLSPGGGQRGVDRVVYDELKNPTLDKEQSGLILPVDDIVVGTVKHLSAGGSLAGDKTFESIHPDLMQEYFAQRLGIEPGGKRTAVNKTGTQASAPQVNLITGKLPKAQAEFSEIRPFEKGDVAAGPGKRLITVTVMFKSEASDDDHIVRLSPGSVRLVCKDPNTDSWKNVFPIGTVQGGAAWLNKPDDFLFIDLTSDDHGAHFLFEVDDSVVTEKPAPKVAPGTFIEIKRLVKQELDDVKVVSGLPPNNPKYFPMRKQSFATATPTPTSDTPAETTPPTPAATPAPESTPTPAPSRGGDNGFSQAPLDKPQFSASTKLPVPVNVESPDKDAIVATTAVTAELKGRKFDSIDIDSADAGSTFTNLRKGAELVDELLVPAGKRMVQVALVPKKPGDWAWASSLGDYTVLDSTGTSHKPNGVYAIVGGGIAQKLHASYKANAEVNEVKKGGGTVASVTLIYLLPAEAKAKELQYRSKGGGPALEQ